MSDLTAQFEELFQGNPNAYGLCLPNSTPTAVRAPVTYRIWNNHLAAGDPIGIYPIHEDMVRWGCVDLDEGYHESWPHAVNLHNVLSLFGVTSHVEKSLSKGYHVWVFTHGCSATLMRSALKAACAIVSAPDKEVNPKQRALQPDQLGNFVRLPYPKWPTQFRNPARDEWRKQTVIGDIFDRVHYSKACSVFVWDALEHRCTPEPLVKLADLYTPPVRPPIEKRLVTGFNGPIGYRERMTGLTWTIYSNGPLEGSDRSGTMFKLACRLADESFTPGEALELITDFDLRFGKFQGRADREQRLEDLVSKAFSR